MALLIQQLGAVPKLLVWDGEGAVGRWRPKESALTLDCQAFRGVLGTKVYVCKPADPEAKGMLERFHDYLERSFLPGREFTGPEDFNTQLAGFVTKANARKMRVAGMCARTTGSPRTGQAMIAAAAGRRRRSGGASRCGCRAITTSGSIPTTTPSIPPWSVGGSRSTPTWTGCG